MAGGVVPREDLKRAAVAEGIEELLAVRVIEAAEKAVTQWEMQVSCWVDSIDRIGRHPCTYHG